MSINPHLDAFMEQFAFEGLTFDDVSLETQYADFLPDEADLRTRLTVRISLNVPFVSAAMDTVTETNMAIGMAMIGGIGIIHKNLTINEQARQVGIVKHYLHGLIRDPIVFHPEDTIADILRRKDEKGYRFSGFPIVDGQNNLVGILTGADIKFARNTSARVADVMTREVISSHAATTLDEAYEIMIRHRIGKLPLTENGKLVGLYSFTDVKTLVDNVQPLYNRDQKHRLRVGAAVSTGDYERLEALAQENVDVIVVDSAHGYSRDIIAMVRWICEHYPETDVIGGNVCTGEGALALAEAGAHAVKVGVGPGSICTTRVVCGVGVPQITAIYRCAKALNSRVPVIADGGIRYSGDVAKALAAGAETVMLGAILAGTEESPGEKIVYQGRQYVSYRGMGSLAAMTEAAGSRERYGQAKVQPEELVPQGIEGMIPYAGPLKMVMHQYAGGLKAALGYCGCRTIQALREKARFARVSPAGMAEAHPHDVKIVRQAPNYPG